MSWRRTPRSDRRSSTCAVGWQSPGAIWLTSRSLAPLDRVSAVAGEIKAGAYDHRPGLRGNDQVANLAIAFDQMVDRLQEQIALE